MTVTKKIATKNDCYLIYWWYNWFYSIPFDLIPVVYMILLIGCSIFLLLLSNKIGLSIHVLSDLILKQTNDLFRKLLLLSGSNTFQITQNPIPHSRLCLNFEKFYVPLACFTGYLIVSKLLLLLIFNMVDFYRWGDDDLYVWMNHAQYKICGSEIFLCCSSKLQT